MVGELSQKQHKNSKAIKPVSIVKQCLAGGISRLVSQSVSQQKSGYQILLE